MIDTSWAPHVARIELRKNMDEPKLLSTPGEAPFIGKAISDVELHFHRRIAYRNSFLPRIRATLEPSYHGGSRLRVRMQLHPLVLAFMGVWMTFATFGGLAIGIAALAHGQIAGLFALAFPVLGASICSIPFAIEARNAEGLLRDIFAPAPALPPPPRTDEPYR